jgi:hypothetical protein
MMISGTDGRLRSCIRAEQSRIDEYGGMLLAWVESSMRDDFHFFSVLSEGDLRHLLPFAAQPRLV